jgi:septum formation protein
VTFPIVLASASPARLGLLRSAGVEPLVEVSGIDEVMVEARARDQHTDLGAPDIALLLARAKAEDVHGRVTGELDALILGCDSVLELEGEVHGKPGDPETARERWTRMRGRSGVLHTGHWLIDERAEGTGATFGATASTTVHFARVTDEDIADYVGTGEPLRVAGAFTLDGLGAPYVSGVEGDPSNVVGLSLPLLREMLGRLGLRWSALTG